MTKYLEFKNFSTILNSILLTVFGLIIGYATSKGINLPFDAKLATTITSGIILLAFSYFNAKHKNSLFDEETDTITIPLEELSETQIGELQSIINQFTNNNGEFDEEQ